MEPLDGCDEIVGRSQAVRDLHECIDGAAASRAPVLISGESGTGKELVARAIHRKSKPPTGSFVVVDCASLVESLIDSELFGYRRGAFTGADEDYSGLLADAHGGTVLFDEISELPAASQARLLRFLQEGEIRPVGSTKRRRISARVIAASNKPLSHVVEAGKFRPDLYYRLAVLLMWVPPLRQRSGDVRQLAEHFVAKYNPNPERPVGISREALSLLEGHSWPGNVRELENCMRRALVEIGTARTIELRDVTLETVGGAGFQVGTGSGSDGTVFKFGSTLYEIQKVAILTALIQADGDRLAAAARLGVGKTTLYRKLQEYAAQGVKVPAGPKTKSRGVADCYSYKEYPAT